MNRVLWLALVIVCGCTPAGNDRVVATGTLEVVEVDVAPIATARVVSVLVDDGATVRAGEVVFAATVRLDTPREREYVKAGGILPYVLRRIAARA